MVAICLTPTSLLPSLPTILAYFNSFPQLHRYSSLSIVLGELYYGANRSAHSKSNIIHIDNFALKSSVLFCDTDTVRHYGQIKDHLRAKGNPIPENDIWIAALAKQYHLTLISRDQHFRVIKEIKVEQW